ncbi:uncharacterized protein [Ptychodera flava]|uniref:uncharacterized protein isoform X1 n=1 Tax=Ptychodera flava TaxID=63121 RepID=UPI00396A03BE
MWHTPKKIHQPAFLEDITIHKIQGNCIVEETVSKSNRFRYDPRAIDDRQQRKVEDMDLDGLREVTGGNAGILCYMNIAADPDRQNPDLSEISVTQEVVVTQEETSVIEEPVLPPSLPELAEQCDEQTLIESAMNPIDTNVVQLVSDATVNQSDSDMWYKYRVGRITATRLFDVTRKVSVDGTVSDKNTSFLKCVMNYNPPFSSPATDWGKYNEGIAIQQFLRVNRKFHRKLSVKQCGLILYPRCPIIAASPDALVTCDCCGIRPLEVKNPYKMRHLSIPKYAELPDSCLHITSSGQIKLKSNHPYFFQVQGQLFSLESGVGYFALKTASPYNNLHFEEICFDPMLMEEVYSKCLVVFKSIIIPELIHGKVRKEIEMTGCNVEQTPQVTQECRDEHVENPNENTSCITEYICNLSYTHAHMLHPSDVQRKISAVIFHGKRRDMHDERHQF